MKCNQHECGGTLGVTHTYTVESQKFQRAVCDRCGTVYRLDTVAVPARNGAGARAMANRAKTKLPTDSR